MQATNVTFDEDTCTLEIRLSTGDLYRITDPFHARAIKEKVSVGGNISDAQRWWLAKYLVPDQLRDANKERVAATLKRIREELSANRKPNHPNPQPRRNRP